MLAPCGSSWTLWLLPSPPVLCRSHEFLQVERRVVFQHIENSSGQLVSHYADCFPLAVQLGQVIHQLLGRGVVADEEQGSFRKGPLQMRIADLGATGSFLLPSRFVTAFHQPAVGSEILDRLEPVDVGGRGNVVD